MNKTLYFIRNVETQLYYAIHFCAPYGHTFAGEPFGRHPTEDDYWVENTDSAWSFQTEEQANDIIVKSNHTLFVISNLPLKYDLEIVSVNYDEELSYTDSVKS